MANYIKVSEAAKLARTDVQWLHKLIKKGELDAHYEPKGMMKYWFVNTECHRFQKLLYRNDPQAVVISPSNYSVDWSLWEDMCARGEEICKRPCTKTTIDTYRYYIQRFFKEYPLLDRSTLRLALKKYEERETRERDFYASKDWLFRAMVTVARYYVFKGYETEEYVKNLLYLRPKKKHTLVSRPCYPMASIENALIALQSAVNKRGHRSYSHYDELLNCTFIMLGVLTGARNGEICRIQLNDIDWKTKEIRLFGKGGKERRVGICSILYKVLKRYWSERPKTDCPYLLVHSRGGEMNTKLFARRFARMRKYIGLMDFTPHSLRRTAITELLKKLPAHYVRDIVGHRDLQTTNLYAQPSATDIVEAMKAL